MQSKIMGALAALSLLGACSSDADQAGAATGAGASGGLGAGGAGSVRPGSQEDLVANVGDRVFFGTDQSSVDGQGRDVLSRQAAWLSRYPQVTVLMEGHADERGTREYNLALGQRRASSARDVLVASGVAGSRIQTVSYGKDRPAALGSDEESYTQNRRAVTAVR